MRGPGRPKRVSLSSADYRRAEQALNLDPDDHWRDRAACIGKDPHWWFPEDERPEDRGWLEGQGKGVCAACPVRGHCLRYALLHREDNGVWGGYNGDELWRLRRAFNVKPRDPAPLLLAPAETTRESA